MSNPYDAAHGYIKDDFIQPCDVCGAKFRVVVPGQKGHEEPEEYYCPENLDEKYKKVGLEVLFSGDLYEIKFDGEFNTVEESIYVKLSRYCIDLINIENYPKYK